MSFNGDLYPTAGADVVMTTKGDMVDYNTSRQRLAIGSANQILQVKSNLPSWETLSTAGSVLTTQGDVLYESASGLARLGFGTTGDVLTTKGTGANPVWETPSASGANTALSNLSSVAVNATIDMNDQIIKDMKAGIGWGKLEEIESYEEASATGNTKTFTLTEDNLDLYDSLVLTYSLTTTAAFNLEIVVDGISSGYSYSVSEDAAGTFTNSAATAQSQFVIMDSTLISTDTLRAMGIISFLPAEQNEGADMCNLLFQGGVNTAGNAWGCGNVAATLASFGSITIQTSTSSWTVHSRFNLMGRRK